MGRHGENIRKRSDGRWEARYMAYDKEKGRRVCRSVYGHTYEEAKAKRTAVSRAENTLKQEKTIHAESFDLAAEKWLAAISAKQKTSTCEKYRFIYYGYLKPALGDCRLDRITESLVREKLASVETASDSLKKSIYCVLNRILHYASVQYQTYFPEIKSVFPAMRKEPAAVFTKSEQARLLTVLEKNMDCFKLAVLLCLFTGLRLGEICALKWKDVDPVNKTLTVKRTVQRLYTGQGAKKTALTETAPKSAHSKREVPLQDVILSLLTDHANGKEYVFGGDKPLDPRTMQNHYKKIIDEAGISYRNFHTLRHTYATNCIEEGADVKSLSEMLGHSNVKITLNYYVHPSMDTKRLYADSLCEFYIRLNGQVLGKAVKETPCL